MSISGVGATGNNWPIHPQQTSVQQPATTGNSRISVPTDQVDFSPMARMMAELQSLEENDPSRAELVAKIRQEIEQGTYDTDEKLEAALVKFLQQIRTTID